MFRNTMADLVYAVRVMAKKPAFGLIVILTLALGIGATTAMFNTLKAALIQSLPYEDPHRLVLGMCTFNGEINPMASAPDYYDYRDHSEAFESLAAILAFTQKSSVTGLKEPEEVVCSVVSVDLFPTLRIRPQLGRNFTPQEEVKGTPGAAMISHGYWQRRFGGTRDTVGQILMIEGVPHTIVGVMPAAFYFLHPIDVWRPMRPNTAYASARRYHNWLLVGRLKSGVTTRQAQSRVDVISAQLESQYPDSNKGKGLLLRDLQQALADDYRTSLLLLMAAVSLVLLISCGNVASLLLARGSARRSELAVRTALGASRARLVCQLLTESVVLAIAAGFLGVALAIWFQRLVLELLPLDYLGISELNISASTLLFALSVSLATGLLFGIVPALRGGRADLAQDLKAGARILDTGARTQFRSGLVVVQVAVSVLLLIGSGLLIRSFAHLRGVDPGFITESLLTAEIRLPATEYSKPDRRIQFYTRLLESVQSIPGVAAAGIINQLPIRDPGNNTYVYAADNPPTAPGDRKLAFNRVVLPGYFKAMGIPLRAGRDIEETDNAGAPMVLVINDTVAKTLFPGQNPLGRRVVVDIGNNVTAEVAGVVGDVRMSGLAADPRMAWYASYWQRPLLGMRIAVRTQGNPASVAGALRKAVWNLDRNIPVAELATMESLISKSLAGSRIIAILLTVFASVALFLAAMGLYGLLAFYVAQRRREIGVRIALGARAGDVLKLVVSRGMALVAAGLILGLVGAFGATRLIEKLLFSVKPSDPATFVAVSLLFGFVALSACLIPAWRAIRVDPVIALQAE